MISGTIALTTGSSSAINRGSKPDRPHGEIAHHTGTSFRRNVLFPLMPKVISPIVKAIALSLSCLFGGR